MRFSDRYNLIADCNLGAIEKAVLYAINRFDGKNEAIFPSVKVLAAKAGLSDRHVQKQLRSLEQQGIISITRGYRNNGSPSVNAYRINFDFLIFIGVPNEVHLVNVGHQGGERGTPGVVNVGHQGGERGTPPYIIDQQPILTANIEQPILTPPKGSPKNILPEEGVHDTAVRLQNTDGLNPKPLDGNSAFEVDDYALFVKHWISRQPGAVPLISSKPAQFVKNCIRVRGLQACIEVIDWVHDSNHPNAVFLHERGNVTFNALFKPEKEADYINLASAWVVSGRKSQALKQERNPFDTESKWEGSREIDFTQYEPLDDAIGEAFEKML